MSAPSTSGLSVELLLRVIDVKYVALLCFALLALPKICYLSLLEAFGIFIHSKQYISQYISFSSSNAYPNTDLSINEMIYKMNHILHCLRI